MAENGICYLYDGSYDGMLSCIFEAYYRHEEPFSIVAGSEAQQQLFCPREIVTDRAHAERVQTALKYKVSPLAARWVRYLFLSCRADKELLALRFVRLAFRTGKKVTAMHGEETVAAVEETVKHVTGEAHLYKGFVRFSVYNSIMAAQIEPKNSVLPLLAGHFAERYHKMCFMIHDKTHGEALVYNGTAAIFPLPEYTPAPPGKEEAEYRKLWKLFYDTVSIEGRRNPKCRMTHMPKRYWGCLTEFDDNNEPPRLSI